MFARRFLRLAALLSGVAALGVALGVSGVDRPVMAQSPYANGGCINEPGDCPIPLGMGNNQTCSDTPFLVVDTSTRKIWQADYVCSNFCSNANIVNIPAGVPWTCSGWVAWYQWSMDIKLCSGSYFTSLNPGVVSLESISGQPGGSVFCLGQGQLIAHDDGTGMLTTATASGFIRGTRPNRVEIDTLDTELNHQIEQVIFRLECAEDPPNSCN